MSFVDYVRLIIGFAPKQEEVGYYRGYGHRPTALGVVGKIFQLVQRIKSPWGGTL